MLQKSHGPKVDDSTQKLKSELLNFNLNPVSRLLIILLTGKEKLNYAAEFNILVSDKPF